MREDGTEGAMLMALIVGICIKMKITPKEVAEMINGRMRDQEAQTIFLAEVAAESLSNKRNREDNDGEEELKDILKDIKKSQERRK